MSNRKRFLAVVLVIMMVFSSVATMGVSAADKFADVPTSNKELTQALSVLNDLKVVRGTGTDPETGEAIFGGDAPVTRQQFALFVARLTTGTPDYFVADPDSPTIFEDVVDPTYFTAINHCVESGIINGYPDGTFKPQNPIQFQEAMKMLVTALGYTSLPYPQGYLSKAQEDGVALIGKWVQTKGFDFTNTGLTDELTRNDMGMLLYNFLLTNYYKLGSVWNGVTGQYEPITDRSPVISKFGITPYMGYVTAVQNYATRLDINDYNRTGLAVTFQGTPIDEREANGTYTRNPRDLQISYADEGAITAAERDRRFINSTNIKDLYVKYEDIGMSKPTDPEQLLELSMNMLGLKIVVYRHTSVAANTKNIALPAAVLIGTKTLVNDSTVNKADAGTTTIATNTVPKIAITDVKSLTLGTDEGVETYNQNKGGSAALGHANKDLSLLYNLYAFTDNGYLVSDNGNKFASRNSTVVPERQATWGFNPNYKNSDGTFGRWESFGGQEAGLVYDKDILAYGDPQETTANDNNKNKQLRKDTGLSIAENSIEQELAKFVSGAGHYELYYVNNGVNSEGLAEFYYIFIPYRAGAVHRYTSATIDIRNKAEEGDRLERVSRDIYNATSKTDGVKVHGGVNEISIPTIADDTARNNAGVAYLYTYFGNQYKDLVIKEELVRAATNVEVSRTRNTSNTAAAVDFTNTAYSSKTFSFVGNASKALGAYQASQVISDRFVLGRNYHVFEDAEGIPLIALETKRPTAPSTPWIYGIITNDYTNNAPIAVPYTNGTVGYRYEVFNATSNKLETIILKPESANSKLIQTGTNLQGTYIGMKYNHADGSYNAWILEDNSNASGNRNEVTALLRSDGDKYAARITPTISNPISSWIDRAVSNRLDLGYNNNINGIPSRFRHDNDTPVTTDGVTTVNRSTILSSGTKVLVYTKTPGSTTAPKAGLYPFDNLPSMNIEKAAFIATGNGDTTRTADVLFITVDSPIKPTTPIQNYGVILDSGLGYERTVWGTNPSTGLNTEYTVKKAFVYAASGTSKIVEVCAPVNSYLLETGRLVGINTNVLVNGIYTVSEVTGNSSDVAQAGRLANTGYNKYTGNSRDALGTILSALPTTSTGTIAYTEATIKPIEAAARTALENEIKAVGAAVVEAYLGTAGGYVAIGVGVNEGQVMTALETAIGLKTPIGSADYVGNTTRLTDPATSAIGAINSALPTSIKTAFNNYIAALKLNDQNYINAQEVVGGSVTTGDTMETYWGKVARYAQNYSMYINVGGSEQFVRLTQDIFKVLYVTDRHDLRRQVKDITPSGLVAFDATKPSTWIRADWTSGNVGDAGGNARVTAPEVNNSWGWADHQVYGLRSINNDNWDTISDRTWAVVTIDKNTGTPLSITLIIANPSANADRSHQIADGLTKNGEDWDGNWWGK